MLKTNIHSKVSVMLPQTDEVEAQAVYDAAMQAFTDVVEKAEGTVNSRMSSIGLHQPVTPA